jgi:Putative motility protein
VDVSSSAASQIGSNVQVALQKQALDLMKTQGAKLSAMIDSAPKPAGSVNSPTQGTFVDAHA